MTEDIGYGDITPNALIDPKQKAEGRVVCKENAVVAGIEEALIMLELAGCQGTAAARDGDRVNAGTMILSARGPARALLAVERTLLNILAHMSGVATATADLVSIAKKESRGKVRVGCTRKTLPGLRYFEKRAVELGGGDTHRLRLDDAVLIKDNHLELAGSVGACVRKAKALIRKAEAVRFREHRLKPSLRLKTQGEIIEFIHDKGLVSTLGGNELPSFISGILGKPWKPSAKGFGGWLDWWSIKISGQPVAHVSRDVEGRKDILATRIFRRTKTFVSNKLWPILDIIVKHHQDPAVKQQILSDIELKILETIETEGTIRTDRLRKKLKLEAKENSSKFHRSLTNIESYALIVGVEDPHPEKHLHANIWQTWDTRTQEGKSHASLPYSEALSKLFVKTIDACVLAREDQISAWFEWSSEIQTAKEKSVLDGAILRSGHYLVSSRVRDVNN